MHAKPKKASTTITDKESVGNIINLLEEASLPSLAKKLAGCESSTFSTKCRCGKGIERVFSHCRLRICPVCQSTKAKKKGTELGYVLCTIQKDFEGMQIHWATFTTPACDAIAVPNEMKTIVQGFRKLTSSREIKPHLLGSFRGIHIKYNSAQDTHKVHIHALLGMKSSYQSRGYLNRDKWRELWKESVGIPRAEQVRVERLEPVENNSLIALAVNKGIYASKPMQKENWTPTGLAAFYSYTKDKRLTAYTGKFKEARKSYIKPHFECLCPECRQEEEVAKYA